MKKPVVLLVPGMLNDHRVWDGVVQAMAGDADVRIADVCSQDSIARMRDDAWAQVAQVPAATPLIFVGFSMGGYVVQDMLATRPREVQGLLLIATSALPETPEGRTGREKTLAAMDKDFPRFVEGVLTWSTHAADPDLCHRLRQMMLDIGPQAARRQVLAIMDRQDHRALLATLQMPVRILCGRQDRVTPPPLSEALASSLPSARLEWLEDTGHMLPCERPQVVAQALRELTLTYN